MVLAQFLLLTLSLAILYFGAEFALNGAEKANILVFPSCDWVSYCRFWDFSSRVFCLSDFVLEWSSRNRSWQYCRVKYRQFIPYYGCFRFATELHLSKPEMKEQMVWHLVLTPFLFLYLPERISLWLPLPF